MSCGTCKYFFQTGERFKWIEGAYITSKLGECLNPVVKQLVLVKPNDKYEISINTHSNEFDESFGCDYQEPNS